MSRVVHFEIHADDPQRAVTFYQQVFNWQIKKWEGPMDYWLVITGADNEPGINGAIMKRKLPLTSDMTPMAAYVCTIGVSSLEESIAAITTHGGTIVVPQMPVPHVGWLAYGQDTEGNIFGVMQPDSTVTA